MSFNIFCLSAMALSLATVIFSIILGIRAYRSEFIGKGDAVYKKHFLLTPFQIFILCFFLGTIFVFVPIYYTDYFSGEIQFARILKSIFLSIHNTMRLFILDGDFDIIENAVTDPERLHYAIGYAYSIYAAFLFVAAPIMTASFVMSFFKNVSAYFKYTFNLSTKIYYISELNEKSVALAANILSESGIRKPLIAFFDVFEDNDEVSVELLEKAKRLGAICFRKDITDINLKHIFARAERKFYFIGEDEDENIKQALELIEYCRESKSYNTPQSQFYVFSTTVDSEALIDAVDNGNMKVRRINENRNLVMSTLRDEPVFEKFIKSENGKRMSILIVGGGNYGTELIKALTWCAQMPDREISIHIVDKGINVKSRFAALAPELMEKNKLREAGEPYYEIEFHQGIDVYGSDFSELLRKIENITAAFVTLGEDELNLDVAMKIRREYGRLNIEKGYEIPNIFAVVYSTLKTQTFLKNGPLCLGEEKYGIKLIGDMRSRFSLGVIEQVELEKMGMDIHLSWLERKKAEIRLQKKDETEINAEIEKSRSFYDKYEYYRRTSIAKAIYEELLAKAGVTFASEEYEKENEHKRWSAFMRAEGYVYNADSKNHIAKTHSNLKPYKRLEGFEKDKDLLLKK